MRAGTLRSPAATRATTTTIEQRTAARRSLARRCSWLLAPLGVCLACTTKQAAVAPAPKPPALHHGPLTDFVPAAGLRWLVQAKPRALLENPVTSHAIAGLVPRAGLDAFATASGVDLRQVPEAVVAGFDYSTVYLAAVTSGTTTARTRFVERLVAGAIDKQPSPGLRRVSGVIGQTPETLLTLDDKTLVVTVGDPTPSRVAEAFARERLKSSPSALHGSALSEMPDLAEGSPLVALAPGPFPEEWQRAANGLLASTVACGAAIKPVEPASFAVTLVLLGDFTTSADAATSTLADAWKSLSTSSTGKLLGLDQGEPPRIRAEQTNLRMDLLLPAEPLIHGLRAAVFADVSEILRISPHSKREADPPAAQ